MIHKGRLLKDTGLVGLITATSRIFGLFREMARAYFLGTGPGSDAFGVAYLMPNLLRRIVGEGSVSAGFVPVFSEYLKKEDEKEIWEYAACFLNLMAFLLFIICLAGSVFAPFLVKYIFARGFVNDPYRLSLTISLTRITFFYLFFISLAALAGGMLNSFNIFSIPAATPIILNITIIASAGTLSRAFSSPAYAFAIGVLVGGAFQFAFQLPFLFRKGFRFRAIFTLRHRGVNRTARLIAPVLFGAGIYPINVVISQLIATYLGGGVVSSLQFSNYLMELSLGIFAVSLSTVILPSLSGYAAEGDMERFRETLSFSLRISAFIAIPATAGLFSLREPIVNLLFRYGEFGVESVDLTVHAITFHSLGIFFIATSRVMVPAFYSMKDTKTPVIVAFIVAILNVSLSLAFSFPLHLKHGGGIAAANSLSCAFQTFILVFFLERKICHLPWRDILSSVARIAGASLLIGATASLTVDYLLSLSGQRVLLASVLLSEIIALFILYLAALTLMGSKEIKEVAPMLKRRLFRNQ